MTAAALKTLILVILVAISSPTTVKAGPIPPDPKINKPKGVTNESPAQSTSPLKDVDVAQPPPERPSDADSYFYPYQSAISFNAGPYFAMNKDSGGIQTNSFFGFNYLWPSARLFHLESALETISNSEGHFWTMGRWNQASSLRWRPYYAAGAGLRLIPQNGLATLLDASHFFVRAAYGAEYGLEKHSSIRGEIALASDLTGSFFGVLSIGYSYGL